MKGWNAPEVIRLNEKDKQSKPLGKTQITNAADIFVLGIIFYYSLNNREHLFGIPSKRENNISRRIKQIPSPCRVWTEITIEDKFIVELIKDMTKGQPIERPGADIILKHPFFWPLEKIESFFKKAKETLVSHKTSKAIKSIESSKAFESFIGDWTKTIHVDMINELRSKNRIKTHRASLLTLILAISDMVEFKIIATYIM